jgi:hypothetical protein
MLIEAVLAAVVVVLAVTMIKKLGLGSKGKEAAAVFAIVFAGTYAASYAAVQIAKSTLQIGGYTISMGQAVTFGEALGAASMASLGYYAAIGDIKGLNLAGIVALSLVGLDLGNNAGEYVYITYPDAAK